MTRDDVVGNRSAGASSRLPFVIGLTGPMAAGKSTVAELLRQRGAEVIDADRVYRFLLAPGSMLGQRLRERFGPTIVGSDGEIDRATLAKIVFSDPKELADVWQGWHRVGAPMRANYRRFAELSNKGARELGFDNTGVLWRSFYDIANPNGDYNVFPFLEVMKGVRLSKRPRFRHVRGIR